ncbi:MAG TPA: hypothetical protein VGK19_26060 [Capsulimonadaceae bacterium]|jgi:hypothetical protein
MFSPTAIRVFLLIAGACQLMPAYSDVSISGGTAKQRQALTDTYSRLPACCKTADVTVQLMGSVDLARFVKSGLDAASARSVNLGAIDGVYQNEIPTITLRCDGDDQSLFAAFAHEFGHFVWQRTLCRERQQEYIKIYKRQKASGRLVTTYAAASAEEGFAEAFSFSQVDPPRLRTADPLSAEFVGTVTQKDPMKTP